jgi:ABC-2 type transport system ATP-binding protein
MGRQSNDYTRRRLWGLREAIQVPAAQTFVFPLTVNGALVTGATHAHNPAPVTDPASVPVLRTDRISRRLAGRSAVNALSLSVARGAVLGLLGVNGAGKSTTLRMVAGVLAPDEGAVLLGGKDLYENPGLGRRGIGYLPERAPLHAELGVVEYLDFCARLHGLSRRDAAAAVRREVERCDLGEVQPRLIGQLSKGFQQRVGIAQALLHAPDLVVLDEPASGLDPVQSLRMRELIAGLRADHAVILSTHLLAEAEACCDHIAILHRGELRQLTAVTPGETARLEQVFLRIAADLDPAGAAA